MITVIKSSWPYRQASSKAGRYLSFLSTWPDKGMILWTGKIPSKSWQDPRNTGKAEMPKKTRSWLLVHLSWFSGQAADDREVWGCSPDGVETPWDSLSKVHPVTSRARVCYTTKARKSGRWFSKADSKSSFLAHMEEDCNNNIMRPKSYKENRKQGEHYKKIPSINDCFNCELWVHVFCRKKGYQQWTFDSRTG